MRARWEFPAGGGAPRGVIEAPRANPMDPRSTPSLTGWGRLPMPGVERPGEDLARLTLDAALTRGLGRSYGDSSLPALSTDRVASSRFANRITAFDPETGVIRAEAGFSLVELNRLFMRRGWFSPVTPGTKFVTLGGMVASDVHGKNHHVAGCFGAHVRALRMRLADGSVVTCGPDEEPELFDATVGGMGLTGHILDVEFTLDRIPTPFIHMESERMPTLDAFLAGLGRAAPAFPMTMGWIDCLHRGAGMGRGILMAGRWATAAEVGDRALRDPRPITMPVDLPNLAINDLTVGAFNTLYYWKHLARTATKVIPPDPFFYPLDAILEWNRVYGPRGFTQYQCVLPRRAGPEAVRAFMDLLTRLGGASPLCVIKDCGPEGRGMLSFPLEGTSVAVDMAVSSDIQGIVDKLNAFVIEAGGRVYLTKDRFTRPEDFRRMEPRLDRFLAARAKYDPQHRLRSAQSVRLFGDAS